MNTEQETGEKPNISIKNLDITYNYENDSEEVKAARDINLDIKNGEIVSLVGESGSGKSTIGSSILNLLPKDTLTRGKIQLDGKNLLELPENDIREIRGKDISKIFQDPMGRLNPLMTVEQHFIELLNEHTDFGKEKAIEKSIDALNDVGIPPNRFEDYPHEFSGGMRQRIMIALALVLNPRILIADEATTSLDVVVQSQILNLLRDVTEKYNTSILNITHNLGVVAEISDRVVVLYGGKVVEKGSAEEIFHKPKHPYTKGLINSVIGLDTEELEWVEGTPPDLVNPPSGCPFHPRCPQVMEKCKKQFPEQTGFNDSHKTWCHLYES
ncbi:MAG: ABC-type dipeptide/oligopeptide/nickel transport system, ATPase component [Candidatus Methanohalarchaeum thermophilum]|uniref:ABC-type dipeptide/oligopeptide/nickel transport system, ATPase component n=1 Tax=Methanohalarchaeum thermophilum TaxID=1903181 RepID=A0A1Q6DT41_METT1|nr:MAG: ABC-type dipeptide/oligopeptide/nickel transport system, ATPase component [Candidatus Methanohalarchaeum thermophilum]